MEPGFDEMRGEKSDTMGQMQRDVETDWPIFIGLIVVMVLQLFTYNY
jgi:hypothetical protein